MLLQILNLTELELNRVDIRVGLSGALYYMDGFSRTVRHLRNLVSQVLLQICVYTAQRSMFGTSSLRQGWRVDGIVINQLLKGLCDSKCASEAMNILLRRMPEFGCSPDVVSYKIFSRAYATKRELRRRFSCST